jgi:adenosine/AMP kinase
MLEMRAIRMEFPADANIIVGQSHFIKTVEDLYEAVPTTVPQAKFGLAFNESSGACLTRSEGNDQALREIAVRNAQALASGHTFVLVIQNAYPINVLSAIRNVPEVCTIFCATAHSSDGLRTV